MKAYKRMQQIKEQYEEGKLKDNKDIEDIENIEEQESHRDNIPS
jgi:hypothetical protein